MGAAVCVAPSAPGLVDETTAGILNNGGALAQNHLYMMTIESKEPAWPTAQAHHSPPSSGRRQRALNQVRQSQRIT